MEDKYNKVEDALEELRKGKIILVSDDKNRENEADTICAAQYATSSNINFMATHAKGLICTPMDISIAERLGLCPMVLDNTDNHETAFTVSIDSKLTRTGISAMERSITIQACSSASATAEDFRRPGHTFPLVAKKGGVLVRGGHTEATVDLCRLAALTPCGVCCEVIAEDGGMLTGEALFSFAKTHNLTYITIKDLQDYCRIHDSHVIKEARATLPTEYGEWTIYGYINDITGEHHVALVKGEIGDGENVLCRVHSECLTGDVFHSKRCDCGEQLKTAMQKIQAAGRGVILYMRQEGRGIGLINKLKAYMLQEKGLDTVEANERLGFAPDLREYWIGAQILRDLGIKSLELLTNNPNKVYALNDFNLKVNKRLPLEIPAQEFDKFYLKTKRDKMGHIFMEKL